MAAARWALVTGASAGLGVHFCRLLAADGFSIVLTARREARLRNLADELSSAFRIDTLVIPLDLGAPGAAAQLHAAVEAESIELDVLINNAGFGLTGPFAELDHEAQLSMLALNIVALTDLTHRFLPSMLTRSHGRILNVGSTAGFQPGPGMAVYYASKAYVNSFTEALATELRGTGVTATASCPGPTATEFGSVAGKDRSKVFHAAAADARRTAELGYRAMMRGDAIAVHGASNQFATFAVRLAPRAAVRWLVSRLNKV